MTTDTSLARLRRRRRVACAIALVMAHVPTPRDATAQQEQVLHVDITAGAARKDQRTMRVRKGDRVRIVANADSAGELHIHGYRIVMKLAPGEASEARFDAYATGRYALEWHPGGGGHGNRGHHAPPLAVLEVHPR